MSNQIPFRPNFRNLSLSCLPSLFIFVFGIKAWFGRGGDDAIRESTGRGSAFIGETKRDSAMRGGRPAAQPDPTQGFVVVSRSAALFPRPDGALKCLISLCFWKSEGRQAFSPY